MKYIEEIIPGDCFYLDDEPYLVTYDFRKNGDKLCYSLISGHSSWLSSNTIVEPFSIYGLDNNNNVYPIKLVTK